MRLVCAAARARAPRRLAAIGPRGRPTNQRRDRAVRGHQNGWNTGHLKRYFFYLFIIYPSIYHSSRNKLKVAQSTHLSASIRVAVMGRWKLSIHLSIYLRYLSIYIYLFIYLYLYLYLFLYPSIYLSLSTYLSINLFIPG